MQKVANDLKQAQLVQIYLSADGWLRIRYDIKSEMRDLFARTALMRVIRNRQARPTIEKIYRETYQKLETERAE